MNSQMERYLSLLLEANARTNLTAIRSPEDIRVRHFEDSLALSGAAELHGKTLLDVGSGAGFPGLALRLAEPSLRLTILEANGKKLDFLRRVCDELMLEDVCLLQGRAELLAHEPVYRESFELVTARGVAHMELLCELCLPFVKPGGLFLAMKEREETCTKLPLLGGAAEESFSYRLSDGHEHLALRIRKQSATPKQYPRAWARMKQDMTRLHSV